MRYIVGTKYRECSVKVSIKAITNCVAFVEAEDSVLPNTYLFKSYTEFSAGQEKDIFIQMPITGKHTIVSIFEIPGAKDKAPVSFEIVNVKMLSLPKQMDVTNMRNADVRHFVRFAQRFAFNASDLPGDMMYESSNKKFKILYSLFIKGKNEQEYLTPARVNMFTKVIEVSKQKFLTMTVPARLCILFHEFSHLHLNEDMYDELESDLNGLAIYLGLGYPRIEAHEIYIDMLSLADDKSAERYPYIKNFIEEYERLNIAHL